MSSVPLEQDIEGVGAALLAGTLTKAAVILVLEFFSPAHQHNKAEKERAGAVHMSNLI